MNIDLIQNQPEPKDYLGGNKRRGKIAPEYYAWQSMKDRCYNRNKRKQWVEWGGRGITVFKKWITDYKSFLLHIGRRPTKKHTLDRINNSGNYEPGNVRWATIKEQNNNRRPRRYAKRPQ